MSGDINYPEIKDSDITYYWWCQDCLDYHPTPWCPWNYTDASRMRQDRIKDVGGEAILVYDLCPECGQVICR